MSPTGWREFSIRTLRAMSRFSRAIAFLALFSSFESHSEEIDRAPTFSRDIAPIVFKNCSVCHRPGQSAPFSLLTYEDVSKHKEQISDVITSRQMPPWMPDPQKNNFAHERRLSEKEIALFQKWVSTGAPKGSEKDLPPTPEWPEGWSLGKPDLVVTMPEAYNLSAEGPDVYRNFIIPVPITATHYVAAVEFRPGNYKVVHHAFIRIDRTQKSRRRDAADPEPGFSGLHAPDAVALEGFFSSWQPGKVASKYPEGLAWPLMPGTDLVVQMHLRHSGKPESVQAQVAFYFAAQPPLKTPVKFPLSNTKIEIPAGATNYIVEDSLQTPVDVTVLGILPHAHYLARRIEAFAELPGGGTEQLLRISNWDFNWQGDYAYERPVYIPAGSTFRMRIHYDNSTNNPSNPFNPPRTVKYGLESVNEMAEIWFQVLAKSKSDFNLLNELVAKRLRSNIFDYNEFILRSNPNDADAHAEMALVLMSDRKFAEAQSHLSRALEINPDFALAHYQLGLLHRLQNHLPEARNEFEAALRLDPTDFKSHTNLGFVLLKSGRADDAESHFKAALEIHPGDELAIYALNEIKKAREKTRSPGSNEQPRRPPNR
jgi:tetratricopeptide (TPR) repeat protein